MLLLPVLDLMQGQIVRGIAGQRKQYRPIVSRLAADSRPGTVARALASRYDCRSFYLADLDAIAGADPAWKIYAELAELGIDLFIDAGCGDLGRARHMARFAEQCSHVAGIILASESIADATLLPRLRQEIPPGRVVFSLDLKAGRLITQAPTWNYLSPTELAGKARQAGFHRLLVLDLAAVGTSQGPVTTDLCRELHQTYPDLEIWSGGGVRHPQDMHELARAGCERVLVASALHDGNWPGGH